MADSFTLPLRPVIERQDRPDTLPVEIAQINNHWGSFRDVNEEVLRAKIAEESERNGAPASENGDQEMSDVDSTERLEKLYKKRADITQFAVQSHMEAMFALDFISLLLSKTSPRQAETSMSAYLKQVAPLGSLEAEVVNPLPKSESAIKDTSTVSQGWRIQNFNSASNKLLKAASRLDTEVASETRYWNEVLAVKEKGWKICRLPRERQALGVQYGFLEASPVFRDRGLASLRRSEDGSLILDKGLIPSGARFVRVRVRQGTRISSSSKPFMSPTGDVESIEHRILQARDSVFEEELFHELVREARSMASSGVTTRQNLIQVPASDDTEILLDLVDADDESIDTEQKESTATDQFLADGLAHSIRILLAFAHRQNLRRRTQPPPPLTSRKRVTPEYHLLRPALGYFQHLVQLRWLESYLQEILAVLRSSGLDVPELNKKTFVSGTPPLSSLSPASVETFLQKFLMPIESVFRGTLLSAQSSFTIKIRTNISAPPFGTHYDVSFNFPSFPDLKSPGRISLRDEVEAAITHIFLLDVVSQISSDQLPAKNSPDGTVKRWNAIYPHLGELLLSGSTSPESNRKMKVILNRRELSLSTFIVRGIDGVGRGARELRSQNSLPNTWSSLSSSNESQKHNSMMDFVIAEASR
ncbi:Mediator complex subunit Med17 [Penicillium malachiteum]|nr:Mediator complex subunit Med17 [Penicillium malachiteum]